VKTLASVAILGWLSMVTYGCKEEVECPEVLADHLDDETFIGVDGGRYRREESLCVLVDTYFEPDFLNTHYEKEGDNIFLRVGDERVPTLSTYQDNFESYLSFNAIFVGASAPRFFTAFEVISPAAKEREAYESLRRCILNGQCDFIDNRISLTPAPEDVANAVLRFETIAPTFGMETSSASIISEIPFYEKGDTFIFSARFRLVEGSPIALVNFENRFFLGHPGTRIILEEGALAFENPFGASAVFRQENARPVPRNVWFTLKFEILFDDLEGSIRVFQDDALIIEERTATMPLANSVQNYLSFGINASGEKAVLLVDDFSIEKQ